MTDNIVSMTKYDLPPKLVTALAKFDDTIREALEEVIESGVHRGMIVALLHAHAHKQTAKMLEL